VIPLFLKKRRKNLFERLNHAIAEFPEITMSELSKIHRKVRPFLKDDKIKSLYDCLQAKLKEHDNQVWNRMLNGLDNETINALEGAKKEWQHTWGHSGSFLGTGFYGKAIEIATKKYFNFVEEELKSWSQIFPVNVIKEIRKSMTPGEVLKAVEYFKDKFRETIYGKEYELYVEGDTDIRYLLRAAELLGKVDLFNEFEIKDAEGAPNLDKLYKAYPERLAKVIPCKTILLYDCDTAKKNEQKGKIYKRTIPEILKNPIRKGIENLFSQSFLDKAREFKIAFIDITQATSKIERGRQITVPDFWQVNKDEKSNLCDWIIQNGTKEDFKEFNMIFDLLVEIKNAI
jgi:hypothetical protein